MDWSAILGAGGLNDQQGQIDQQLADVLARRRGMQPGQYSTGLGALLGGIGGLMQRNKFDTQEAGLRQQRQDVSGQMAGLRSEYAKAMMGASPEDASKMSGVGMLTGDPAMGAYAQHAPQMALQQQQFQQGAERFPLQQAMERQKLEAGGPQAALGGQTPGVFEMLTKREQVPKFSSDMFGRFDTRTGKGVSGGPGGGGPESLLTPEAIDQSAALYLKTGQLPSFGRANPVIHGAIVKRAAELSGGADIGANRASYGADKGSLASQQKILDNAESWERTGKANLDVLLGIAQKLHDTGSPWINRPVRLFADKAIGDPNQTAFRAAHATVVNEYAKILSGAQGSGAVTEGARHEAESMLPLDATWEQLSAAAKVLDTDAGNRIGAARQQVSQIHGRMSGKAPAQAAAPSGAPAAPAPPPTSARPRRTANGETREWDGNKWVPAGAP